MYIISGHVKDVDGQPLIRKVFLLNKDTMSVLDSVYSKIDGSFEFKQYTDDRRLVLIKSEVIDQSNSIVIDNINPVWDGVPNPSTIDTIGIRGTMGFGVGYCLNLPPEFIPMPGHDDPYSENYGNYKVISDGSIMVWIPKFYYKWGTGSNGLTLNDCDIKGTDTYANETLANADGYALHRAFIDGGAIKDGFFIDKFMCSKHPTLAVASSINYGAPLSCGSGSYSLMVNFGFSNNHANVIPIAKLRGNGFHCQSIFQRSAIALLAYAHGNATTDTNICGWYSSTNNFPRGNMNYGRDTYDPKFSSLSIYDDTYYCYEGRGQYKFETTTHNGQANGIAGIVGNKNEILIGFTSASSKYFTLKETQKIYHLTEGNTSATDHWGTLGMDQFDDIGANIFDSFYYGYRYIDNNSKVFNESSDRNSIPYKLTNSGIPIMESTVDTQPTPYIFGGAIYPSQVEEVLPFCSGSSFDSSYAGLWYLHFGNSYMASYDYCGFRSAYYIS